MPRSTASIRNHRNRTSTTAETRGEVNCAVTSRGGWISTRHTTATTTMPEERGSNGCRTQMIVAYSEPTATRAGSTAWAPVNSAIKKALLELDRLGHLVSVEPRRSFAMHFERGEDYDKFSLIIGQFHRVMRDLPQMLNRVDAEMVF